MANRSITANGTDEREASSTTPLLKRGQNDIEIRNSGPGYSSNQHVDDEWEAEDNLNNPRNWKRWFKWTTVILVSFIEFLTTMPNFMYAPNITDAQEDLGTSDSTLATFSLTIYILGFALGPLLFAPLSELYGRTVVYRLCLAAFLAMTVGCGISQNIEMLVAFRFLAGSFGAAPVAIGGAVVGDLFPVEERGTAMSVYQAGQIISAVVGPPIGGLIGSYLVWRWVFWIVCILVSPISPSYV
jgi:multidrug resistance protein